MITTDLVFYFAHLILSIFNSKRKVYVIKIMPECVIPAFQDEKTKINNYILNIVRCNVGLK